MIRSIPRPTRALMGSPLAILVASLACAPAQAQDSWDAVYRGGSKIGHIHTWVEKVSDRGRDYNRVRIDIEQRLKRRDDETVIRLMYGTIETLDGEVLKLDTRTQAGETQDIRVHGDAVNHRMNLVIEGTGRSVSRVIAWDPDVRGPYGAEQSMARKPMKEHEKRPIKMFIPELNKVCDVMLESRTIEPVLLGDGTKRPLLRVDQTTTVDGKRKPEYDARLYVDQDGQVLKSEQDVLGGLVVYRTTEAAAKAPAGPVQFDLIMSTVVKVGRKIPSPEQTRHVRYRLSLKDSEPGKVFPADARQSLQAAQGAGPNLAIMEIKSIGPLDGEAVAGEVDAQYTKPNAIVTSDDVRVRSLATRVTRGLIDPWEKATAINKWVAQNVKDKNFKVAFAAASEVARNLSGDCTEHSVLAAAMCRAVGIPSRVAIGLIYVDELEGFGYHMWAEVYVNNRWVAIDPSFDQTTVDAVHIKLADTSLDGVAPFEAFLPVVSVVGRLTIEPIEIR
jgi:transglutaminase-like putative cysteine protease